MSKNINVDSCTLQFITEKKVLHTCTGISAMCAWIKSNQPVWPHRQKMETILQHTGMFSYPSCGTYTIMVVEI